MISFLIFDSSIVHSSADVHFNLGLILKDLNKIEQAEKSFREAIKINPNFFEAHSNLGLTLLEQKRLNKARDACIQAINLNQDYVTKQRMRIHKENNNVATHNLTTNISI